VSSRNAWKGGTRPYLRNLSQVLREQEQWRRAQMINTEQPDDTAN
tara:strand:+ start:6076 stop:6210 length:135 start_codon:yes stop_codon:yes gene_type:complete